MSEIVQDKPPAVTDGSPVITDSSADDAAFESYLNRSKSVLGNENVERQQILQSAGVEEPAQILDSNIDSLIVNQTPKAPEPVPVVSKEEPKVEIDLLDKLLSSSKEPEPQPNSAEPTISSFTQEQVNDMIAAARAEEALKWEEANKTFKQYEENPYQFLSQVAPHLFKSFDTEGYVNDKLESEFGKDFQPIAEESLKFNSPSNKYLRRQMELEQEALSLQKNADSNIEQSTQETNTKFNEFKLSVMTKYGFDNQADFDQQVWNDIAAMNGSEVWETLVKYKLLVKNADTIKKNLRQQPSKAFQTPGITDLSGAPNQLPDAGLIKEMNEFFPQERFGLVNIIR